MDLPAGCFSQTGSIFYWNSPPYWDGSPCSYCISVCSLGRGIFMFLAPINILINSKVGPTILYVSKHINILESNFYSSDTCASGTCKCGTSAECRGSLCISGVCEGRSLLNWCRNYWYFCLSIYMYTSSLAYVLLGENKLCTDKGKFDIDENDCKKAAGERGLFFWSESTTNYPSGCYRVISDWSILENSTVYFNRHSFGSRRYDAAPICRYIGTA